MSSETFLIVSINDLASCIEVTKQTTLIVQVSSRRPTWRW